MPLTSYSGIQGFWNYDTFSLLGPMAGRSQAEAIGFINTFTQNLCFTQTDITLRFHNNPPVLTRTFNSHNRAEDIFFKNGGHDGVSFMGKDWMLNFEHCLFELPENQGVWEIDPTGCRNFYTYNAGNYLAPPGTFKELVKFSGATTYIELTTRDYFTYHFEEKQRSMNLVDGTFYGLTWIKDRNGVMIIVHWSDDDTRISSIRVCPTEDLYNPDDVTTFAEVIVFDYYEPGKFQGEPDIIASYQLATPALGGNLSAFRWDFSYFETSGDDYLTLTKANYPMGAIDTNPDDEIPGYDSCECFYEFEYVYSGSTLDSLNIYDMNRVKWSFAWGTTVNPTNLPAGSYYHLARDIYAVGESLSPFSSVNYYISYTEPGPPTPYRAYVSDAVYPTQYWVYQQDSFGRLEYREDLYGSSHRFEYTWSTVGGKWIIEQFVFPSQDYILFTYNNATANLEKVEYYDWNGGNPQKDGKYSVCYEYDGTDIYLVTSVRFDEVTAGVQNEWWSQIEFDYEGMNLIKIRAGLANASASPPDVDDTVITPVETIFSYEPLINGRNYGNVKQITGPEGAVVKFFYNESLDTTAGSGFGAINRIEAIDPNSLAAMQVSTYEWWPMEIVPKTVTGPGGYQNTVYSARLELMSASSLSGVTLITYDKMSNPRFVRNGQSWTYYDYKLSEYPINMPVQVIAPGNGDALNMVSFTYDARGDRITRTFTSQGNEYDATYTYDLARRLVTITSEIVAGGATESVYYSYDNNGNLASITDDGSNVTSYQYNFAGQLVLTIKPASALETNNEEYLYDYAMGIVSQINRVTGPQGSETTATWTYRYDRLGRCIEWTKPTVPGGSNQTFSTQYFYNRNSNLIAIKYIRHFVDPEHEPPIDEYSYRHEFYEYDVFSRLTRMYRETDEDKTIDIGYVYDELGHIAQATAGGLIARLSEYNENGQLSATYKPGQDPKIDGTRYVYCCGQVSEIHGAEGNVVKFFYDEAGRVVSFSDACGRTYRREYTENGLLERLVYPSGDFIGYEYDGLGRIIRVWETVLDINLDPTTITDNPWGIDRNKIALTLIVEYSWAQDMGGALARKVSYKTAYSATPGSPWVIEYFNTEYQFNRWGQLEQVSFPSVGSTTTAASPVYHYHYDYRGNLTQVDYWDTNPGTWRTITVNSYDDLNRRLGEDYSETISSGSGVNLDRHSFYGYCCCSLTNASQSRDVVTKPVRELAYDRDRTHRLLQEKYTDYIRTGTPATIVKDYNYQWDNASRLIKFSDPVYGASESNPHPTLLHQNDNTGTVVIERADPLNPRRANAETYQYKLDSAGRVERLMMPDETGDAGEGPNAYIIAVDYGYAIDGKIETIHAQNLEGNSTLYFLTYSYDMNGRMNAMVVKRSLTGRAFDYRAHFYYDGRGQLIKQIYDTWTDSNGGRVKLLTSIEVAYDLAGNVITKQVVDDSGYTWDYTFDYDTGYRVLAAGVNCDVPGAGSFVYTYTFAYDPRGNMNGTSYTVFPGLLYPPFPIDLPAQMTYDSHNQLVEYLAGSGPATRRIVLHNDPVGRVFRKEEYLGVDPEELVKATHYYYMGSQLVQEYEEDIAGEEHELDLKWDYLRGADGEVMRRREADVAPGPDRQHINDPMGTNKVDLAPRGPGIDGTEYVLSAEGEPLEPRTTGRDSHIRFHGGFLEDKEFKAAAGSDRGHLYRMGVRHYSPALGRFLQRDPFYNAAMVTAEQPLSINPYIYGYNQPTQYSDTSGYACCGQSAAGGLAETEPLRDKKKTGGYTGAGCIIPWPIDWGCWFPTCLCYCCVDEYGEKCSPCFHGVCEGVKPLKTAAECRAWCDNAAGGGENHPSIGFNATGIIEGPMGPPLYGPGGRGGFRPVHFPMWIFLCLPESAGHIPTVTINNSINNNLQSNINGNIDQLEIGLVPDCPMPPGDWGAGFAGFAFVFYLAGGILNEIADYICSNYNAAGLDSDYTACLCDCCDDRYGALDKWAFWLGVAGIPVSLIGLVTGSIPIIIAGGIITGIAASLVFSKGSSRILCLLDCWWKNEALPALSSHGGGGGGGWTPPMGPDYNPYVMGIVPLR